MPKQRVTVEQVQSLLDQGKTEAEIKAMFGVPADFHAPEKKPASAFTKAILPTVGGIAGFSLGGPVGAGIGAAGGEFLQQQIEKRRGDRESFDVKEIAITGGLSAIPFEKAIAPIAKRVAPKLAEALQQTTLRLNPTERRNLGMKVKQVTDWLTNNKIIGTPEARFNKVDNIYEATEETLQGVFKKEAKDVFISKQKLVSKIGKLLDKYVDERDLDAIRKQVKSAQIQIKNQFPNEIPIGRLNNFKRSTYKNAYNKAGNKVLDEVEHDIGDATRELMELAMEKKGVNVAGKSLSEFNREYGTILNARKILRMAQFRKQVGIIPKLLTSLAITGASGATGGVVGGIAGGAIAPTVVEHAGGGLVRSVGAVLLNQGVRLSPEKVGAIVRGLIPIIRRSSVSE